MAYLPVKARSELVTPWNCCDGGVCESTRRFQPAPPVLVSPAGRRTSGSGDGGVAETDSEGVGAPPAAEELDPAQAAVRATRVTNTIERVTGFSLGWEGGEHRLHAGDLGGLIHVDVVGELEDRLVPGGAGRGEQGLDHRNGPAVLLDHRGEEESVERRAAGLVQ